MSIFYKNKKFQTRILKILILISIIPLIIIASGSQYFFIKTSKNNISKLQSLAIDSTSEKVKAFLNEKMEVFNLVLSGTVNDVREVDAFNLDYLITNLKDAAGDVIEISFTDKSGNEIVKKTDELNNNLFNISKRKDFQVAYGGNNYFGPVDYSDKVSTMRLSSQIENSEREIIGVISALIDLSSLEGIINQIKLGETGYVYLVDSEGRVMASHDDNLYIHGTSLVDVDLITDVISGNEHDGLELGDKTKNSQNERVIFAGRNLGMANWSVISEWPISDAYKVIYNIIVQSIIIIILTLILVIILSIFLAHKITKPIKQLADGAIAISKGNLEQEIVLKTADEFEVLSREFNEMVKVIKENKDLRDQFVFVAAHELRTPVTAIKGYLSMVLDGSFGVVDEKVLKILGIVNKSNDRLVQLVQDLLQIARSEAGKMKIDFQPIKISEVINDVLSELKSLADDKNINVRYIDNELATMVEADNYKLHEVLVNLIGNAIKYTLDMKHIIVSHEIKGDMLVTHIKDKGIGISEEDQKKLFSKFYRVQNNVTVKIEGTGLGLFICKEIVNKMNGEIWMESYEGEGSTFSFSLKIVK